MTKKEGIDSLLESVSGALDLLADYDGDTRLVDQMSPLPSLLAQCEAMVADADRPEPVRSIHHFACTGGTIVSKVLSAMPNVVLLSEIDPLSTMTVNRTKPRFAPTDLILSARHAFREVDEAALVDVFLDGLDSLMRVLREKGQITLLRDHAHSHYCTERDPASRPTLHAILAQRHEVRSVVSVRHPMESYLSLVSNGWHMNLSPAGIDIYAARYLQFLDAHEGAPVFRYEDFAKDPATVSAAMCAALGIDWSPTPLDILSVVKMTGDSGRGSDRIAPRPDKAVPTELRDQARASRAYAALCEKLGYQTEN